MGTHLLEAVSLLSPGMLRLITLDNIKKSMRKTRIRLKTFFTFFLFIPNIILTFALETTIKIMAKNRIPHGKRINYEDDVIVVYNEKNEIVEKGLVDYSAYKDEPYTWNEKGGYYDLPHGYKMVCVA